jgi:hypothetical protein
MQYEMRTPDWGGEVFHVSAYTEGSRSWKRDRAKSAEIVSGGARIRFSAWDARITRETEDGVLIRPDDPEPPSGNRLYLVVSDPAHAVERL